MGFLRQHNPSPAQIPQYTGLQIQTSSNAVPIAIVYGTNRVAPNAIWTGGFYSIAQYQKSGGKGGLFGGKGSVSSYEYYSAFMMGLCEGPIKGYGLVFGGQTVYQWGQSGLDLASLGGAPQTPWWYLNSYYPSQALGYNGLAYIAAHNFDLGSSPSLPQFSFEIRGINSIWAGNVVNGKDSDPALIIQDFLTNSQYGVGFPAGSINAASLLGASGDSSYQTYCRAAGLALSPVLNNQESANSIIARWLKLTNSAAVWSGGTLKFIPYGDAQLTGATSIGSVTFNPNVTPLYNLADDDFIHEDGKDPLEVIRADPYASFNWQRVQISQRNPPASSAYTGNPSYYVAVPIDAFDQNAIELYGLRMAGDITASDICDPKVGQTAAQLILQRQLYIRNTYQFKLSFEYCLFEPMDLVTVTDTALGLNNVAVRITSIEEDDTGLLAVTAEEFPGGTATSAAYSTQGSSPNSTDQGVVPARVNTPVVFEPPAAATGGVAQICAAVSGGVASVFKLSEDGSAGLHYMYQVMNASQTTGTEIAFSVYVKTAERSALRLDIYNGSANIGCDFDLATGAAGTPDAGIDSATISASGSGWFQCAISCQMAANANPLVYVFLENPYPTPSYTGTIGNGLLVWGAEFSAGTEAPSMLLAFTSLSGATLPTNGTAPPSGTVGSADPNWGGAFVWISTDNATYGNIGTITAPARQGVLTASLAAPASSNPDVTHTLSVNLIESGGVLSSGTAQDAQNGVTLCLVDNELLAYQTAALTGTNAYNLTYLYRGLYGTTPAAHSIGAPFARVDGAIFQYPLPASFIGVPLYMKFQSFNIFGQAVEDLSECAVYNYTPSGAGQPLGPVSQALSVGSNLDYGLASAGVNESDDFGLASDSTVTTIDMGLASS